MVNTTFDERLLKYAGIRSNVCSCSPSFLRTPPSVTHSHFHSLLCLSATDSAYGLSRKYYPYVHFSSLVPDDVLGPGLRVKISYP